MNLESLKAEKAQIIENLRSATSLLERDLTPLKAIEDKIKVAERLELIKNVNAKHERLRAIAKEVFECEQPSENILCNDGSFHATKIKKYPKLAALKYASGVLKDGLLYELRVNGETFRLYKTKYEYNKPEEHAKIQDFEEFLNYNSIMAKNITIEEYNEIAQKIEAINNEFKEAAEKFSKQKSELDLYNLNHFGLVSQQSVVHIYEFRPNK